MSQDVHMRAALGALAKGNSLSAGEAAAVFTEIMAGQCAPAQIGALLMGMAQRGETMAEIVSAVKREIGRASCRERV